MVDVLSNISPGGTKKIAKSASFASVFYFIMIEPFSNSVCCVEVAIEKGDNWFR